MSATRDGDDESIHAADALLETRRRFSIVWLVPIVAVCIGAWLVYKAKSEQGPLVSITFSAGEGVVAGKTKVKFRDVEIGTVEAVELSHDLSEVLVTARLARELEAHLTDETTFWVVRPQLTGSQVSGLETLLSGVYIAMDPGKGTSAKRHFRGLDTPPAIAVTTPGRHFVLQADSLGSLDVGSPIYFRRLKAGQVTSYHLSKGGSHVAVRVFIDAPFDDLVDDRTRFWNASGITASLGAEGIKVRTESLAAILAGGIAFDTPHDKGGGHAVAEDHLFRLHETREGALAPVFERKTKALLYFRDSVRGLAIGAPVEVRGIKIGEVIDIQAQGDLSDLSITVAVMIEYETGHIKIEDSASNSREARMDRLSRMVEKGFRGQLQTGSLLTGQLFVDLDFHPDAPPAHARYEDDIVVIPTIQASLDVLRADVQSLLRRLKDVPFEEIGNELRDAMRGASELTNSPELRRSIVQLRKTLSESETLFNRLNERMLPELEATLEQSSYALQLLQANYIREDSPVHYELTRALQELAGATRSIRLMADYLERHPDALIKGKGK